MFEKEKKPKCLKCPLQYDQGEVIFGDGQLQLEMSTIICRKTILKPVIVRALVLNIVLSKGDIFLSFPLACTVFFSCFFFFKFFVIFFTMTAKCFYIDKIFVLSLCDFYLFIYLISNDSIVFEITNIIYIHLSHF